MARWKPEIDNCGPCEPDRKAHFPKVRSGGNSHIPEPRGGNAWHRPCPTDVCRYFLANRQKHPRPSGRNAGGIGFLLSKPLSAAPALGSVPQNQTSIIAGKPWIPTVRCNHEDSPSSMPAEPRGWLAGRWRPPATRGSCPERLRGLSFAPTSDLHRR